MTRVDQSTIERGSSTELDALEQAVARGACFGRTDFRNEDLRAAWLPNIDLRGSRLLSARLDGANLQGACFRAAEMRDVSLKQANLRHAGLREANLFGADLRGSDLRNANLMDAKLQGAQLNDAQIDGAAFNVATLRGADLEGARFHGHRLSGRMPILQLTGIGRLSSTLTVYRRIDGCLAELEGQIVEEHGLASILAQAPHDCAEKEFKAIADLVATHRERVL